MSAVKDLLCMRRLTREKSNMKSPALKPRFAKGLNSLISILGWGRPTVPMRRSKLSSMAVWQETGLVSVMP